MVPAWDKRVPDKTPGHVRGLESSRYESHRPSGQRQQYDMCKFSFVTHWNCQGREVTFPHPPNRGRSVHAGPLVHNPVVRVREELTGRPKGIRPVAEGKPGKAATRARELRPVINQE